MWAPLVRVLITFSALAPPAEAFGHFQASADDEPVRAKPCASHSTAEECRGEHGCEWNKRTRECSDPSRANAKGEPQAPVAGFEATPAPSLGDFDATVTAEACEAMGEAFCEGFDDEAACASRAC